MSVLVEIKRFSGPMDLLLYLIRKEEMDIFDINIHEITKQYLDQIKQMKKLNLETAGDFVAMAATLIQIKARTLVPQYNEDGEVMEDEDPRKELVNRLLEYQMYQEAGKNLYNRHLVGRDVWLRGQNEKFETPETDIIIEEDNALFALISAYRTSMRQVKKAVHMVAKSLKSVREHILEIKDRLIPGRQVAFSTLLNHPEDRKGDVLITFLSMLELAKMGLVNLFQSNNFDEIHVEAKRNIEGDVLNNVENYEHTQSTALDGPGELWIDEADKQVSDQEEELAVASTQQQEVENLEDELIAAATDEEIFAEEALLEQAKLDNANEEVNYGQEEGQQEELKKEFGREPESEI